MKSIFQNQNLTKLFISTFLFFTNEAIFLPTLPLYLSKAGYTNTAVGMILGAFAFGVLTFRPLSGFVTDRMGRKPALVIGVMIFFLAPGFYLFSTTLGYLLVVRFFHGLGITFYTTAYPTLVTDIASPAKRGEVLGHIATATTLSFVLGPWVGMTLYTSFGFHSVIWFCIGVGFINLTVILQVQETAVKGRPRPSPAARESLFSRAILVSSSIQIVNAVIFGGIMTFLPILLAKNGLNAALFFMVESLIVVAVRITLGHLSDQLGRGPVFFYSFLIVLVAVFSFSQMTTLILLIVTAALFGMGNALSTPSLSALVADESDPSIRGMVYGLFYGAFDFGVVIAGVLLGALADQTSLEEMFGWTSLVGLVSLILFALFIQKGMWHSLVWTLKIGVLKPPLSK